MKLPRAIRFFRKPDHISFLIALVFVIISNFKYIKYDFEYMQYDFKNLKK